MDNTEHLTERLYELKVKISNNDVTLDEAAAELSMIESSITLTGGVSLPEFHNPVKNLMVKFNISNYSDMTVIFVSSGTDISVIEESGSVFLCRKIEDYFRDDPDFFRGMERIEIGGLYFRIFYESMVLNDSVYTVLSLSESGNFRPTRFHILSDLIMDYIRSAGHERGALYNDLFDDTLIEFSRYISIFDERESSVLFFRYEYIAEFMSRIGLAAIIEMSGYIKLKLAEIFGQEVSIIRLSLSNYIVVAGSEAASSDLERFITDKKINFIFKGILLPYTVLKVPYKKDNSIYDIFEQVYHLNNYLKTGDVRI